MLVLAKLGIQDEQLYSTRGWWSLHFHLKGDRNGVNTSLKQYRADDLILVDCIE